MADRIEVFDRRLLRARRERAAPTLAAHDFLFAEVATRLVDRLADIRRDFSLALDLGCHTGFVAQAAAAAVIEFASRLGIPLSTTHVITSTIIGQGATRRLSAVSWGLAGEIVMGWAVTFPLVGLLAWLCSSFFGFAFQ